MSVLNIYLQYVTRDPNARPTGITIHNKHLQRGLVAEVKYLWVANYAQMMNKGTAMIAHACGLKHARELTRELA